MNVKHRTWVDTMHPRGNEKLMADGGVHFQMSQIPRV